MKVLKIVLFILFLLALVFMSLGFFFPKVTYDTQIVIEGKQMDVWNKFNNINDAPKWIDGIKSIEPIKVTPDTLGSMFKMVVEDNGRVIELEELITGFDRPHMLSLNFDIDMMTKNDVFYFSEKDGKTTIKSSHVCESETYMGRCMFALMKGVFKNADQKNMQQFKVYAEGK